MPGRNFEDLEIYKSALRVSLDLYKLTFQPTFKNDYAFIDQFRRALLSITSNISEGFERNNNREFRRFLLFAKGSAGEVRSQLNFGAHLGYFKMEVAREYNELLITLSRQIKAFIKYLENWKPHRGTSTTF